MVNFPRDDPQDFDLDDTVPTAKTRWHGSRVEVTARLVPRYLWTTASIDVYLDGLCILRTGGQMKIIGSSSAEFHHDGSAHPVDLCWGVAFHNRFPYELRIDGAKVAVSEVAVENAWLVVVPLLALASPILLLLMRSLL